MKEINILFIIYLFSILSLKVTDASPISRNNEITKMEEHGSTVVESISKYPYLVSIQAVSGADEPMRGHMCGGAVISVTKVITSAICVVVRLPGSWQPIEPTTYRVFSSSVLLSDVSDVTTRVVKAVYEHPSFDINTLSNNIAILEVATPFVIGVGGVIPVVLGESTPPVGTDCVLLGWTDLTEENTYSNVREIASTVADSQACALEVGVFGAERFCAVNVIGAAPCPGDFGAPLICGSQLHGLLSSEAHCEELSSQPSIYTRMQPSLTWIREQLDDPGNSSTTNQFHYALILLALIIAVY